MADGLTVAPVLLNHGLDLVTPPLLVKSGALIDCLNYEMTGDIGYKRIDGYERFDGYPNGAITRYYTATINANTPAQQGSIGVGTVITRVVPGLPGTLPVGDPATNDVGIIVAVNGSNNYSYVPYDDSGIIKNTDALSLRNSAGTTILSTAASNSTDGRTSAGSASAYLTNLRSFSSTLRAQVLDAPGNIAGMWWYRGNLYLAVDAAVLDFVYIDKINPGFYPGSLIRFNGIIYRMIGYVDMPVGTAPVPGQARIAVYPVGTSGTVANTVVEVTAADVAILTRSNFGTLYGGAEDWAYVVKAENPSSSTKRQFTPLSPSYRIPFDAGTYTPGSPPTGTGWTIRNTAGTQTMNAEVVDIQLVSGTFAGSNAAGFVVVAALNGETGTGTIVDNYEMWYGGARRMTVDAPNNSSIVGTRISGTTRLLAADTRYQTINANFYGNYRTLTTYGATGSSRGFWCTRTAFGNLYTQTDEALDQPKYVAYHATRLSLGYEVGSVVESVVGSPLNFAGVSGARELATGDKLTGIVEAAGDTLVVFGRNSVRSIHSDGSMETISSKAGAFDYTAITVGQDILYTGVSGISSLQQSAAYGDFEGKRASASIQTWLRPRLLVDSNGFEAGGVAMALPVRNKNQYRLFFKNGDVIFLTVTGEGYAAMKVNYGNGNDLRVPFAWSSDVDDTGGEKVHVAWNYDLASKGLRGVIGTLPSQVRAYQLESGWGFDGVTFSHYFDLAHTFINNGSAFTGIELATLHGMGYGIATLNLRTAGIETDYDQAWSSAARDISLPATPVLLRDSISHFLSTIDSANWGTGVKMRIEGTNAAGLTVTEPSHICQVLVMQFRSQGANNA